MVGLGNPGDEYLSSRHNVGRMALDKWRVAAGWPEWQYSKKALGLVTTGDLPGAKLKLLLPETMMNNSGRSVKALITSAQKRARLIVIHDDLDLPLGAFKLSFGRGSAGHRGVESVIRALKSRDFLRLRVGVTPSTPGGKLKKPKQSKDLIAFILGKFSPTEFAVLNRAFKKITAALTLAVTVGRERAMSEYN